MKAETKSEKVERRKQQQRERLAKESIEIEQLPNGDFKRISKSPATNLLRLGKRSW